LYNKERYIEACIQSIKKQKYKNIEIIVIDDGSTDNSYYRVKAIDNDDIKIVRQRNLGVSAARNEGIKHSTGEFVAFLDADDFWDAHFIQSFVNDLQKEGAINFWSCGYYFYNNGTLKSARHHKSSQPTESAFIDYFEFSRIDPIVTASSVIIRKSIISEDVNFDNSQYLGEDLLLWIKIIEKEKLYFNPDMLSYYRYEYSNNISRQNQKKPSKLAILDYLLMSPIINKNKYALKYYFLYLQKNARREALYGNFSFSASLVVKALISLRSKSNILFLIFYLLRELLAISILFCIGFFKTKVLYQLNFLKSH
jgi:glycosyltransferase involved in cell wall biosynthesis